MKALMFFAPGVAELVNIDEPDRGASEALVAPIYVGLCGTDIELFAGAMPYFASGDASYPIQPGHEVVAKVLDCPETDDLVGSHVLIDPVVGCGACDVCSKGPATRCADRRELGLRRGLPGGAAERILVPVANLHRLPPGLSPRDAVLGEPGVTVLNAVNRLGDVGASNALVVGPGTLGLIAVQLLRSRGATVDVCADTADRAELLDEMGSRVVMKPRLHKYDVVLEAAGTADAVKVALQSVASGGTVALTGVQPAVIDRFDVNQIVLRDVTVSGVLNGPGLYAAMLDELASGAVDGSFLIDSEFELDQYGKAIHRLHTQERAKPKVLLRL